ncbi:MAG: Orotate phosphoribosyltransferase [Xylophilus sp.]|nr:MAG: Orotate phosphoribosyltransferase [Xylophilus sp.]
MDYAYPWAELIGRFKFHAEPGWAAALAALIRSAPGAQELLAPPSLVLPMPLAPSRLRERGYNQAFELARRLAPAQADARLLLRTRDTASQLGLDRAARLRNVRGAFAVEPLRADAVAGQTVVLVDDVMTTGASLHAAAEALLRAGAASVSALVVARTPAA